MHFTTILSASAAFLIATTSAETVSYDPIYDDPSRSLTSVSCSDGANGLITRYGWQTQGSVPGFPNIGGAMDIGGWNSAACGQCFKVTYNGQSIFVVGIDHAGAGLNLSKLAMDKLTKNQAEQLGRVEAVVERVGARECGITTTKKRRGMERRGMGGRA